MTNGDTQPPHLSDPITRPWSWWSDFLQREYYSGPAEASGWDAVATSIAKAVAAEPGMRLLDLGCGAGDVVLRMAMRGLDATGVELSEPLVEHCRRRALDMGVLAGFVAADMFAFEPEDQYDVVLSLNTSFGYGTDEQNRALIENVGRWLKPDGVFYLDVVTADAARAFGQWQDELAGGTLMVDNEYDAATQRMISAPTWVAPDGSVTCADSPEIVRIYRRAEIESMMTAAGLRPERLRHAMARAVQQTDREMLTTWVAGGGRGEK